MVKAITTKVSLIVAALALAMALSAAASLGLSPAHAKPYCDGPHPPPICSPDEDPPPPLSPTRPANDMFSNASRIDLYSGERFGNTLLATMEPGERRYDNPPGQDCGIYGRDNSVWFKFTTPPNFSPAEALWFETGGSKFDTVLALYSGSSLGTLQQVDCSNNNARPNWTDSMYVGPSTLSAGTTYYVQLTGTGGARSGAYRLGWYLAIS